MFTPLTELPNIGKAIAADLVSIGINSASDLVGRDSLAIFNALKEPMGLRHDPCVYYTLLSVQHFLITGDSLPWWKFTAQGKANLAQQNPSNLDERLGEPVFMLSSKTPAPRPRAAKSR
jgi:DNA transformation protein